MGPRSWFQDISLHAAGDVLDGATGALHDLCLWVYVRACVCTQRAVCWTCNGCSAGCVHALEDGVGAAALVIQGSGLHSAHLDACVMASQARDRGLQVGVQVSFGIQEALS
jgi:hypothetical protein